jgi:hypothetical protein
VRAFLSSEAGYLRRKNLCSNVFSDLIVGVAKACFVKDAPPDALKPDAVITIRKGLTYEVRVEDWVKWGCG